MSICIRHWSQGLPLRGWSSCVKNSNFQNLSSSSATSLESRLRHWSSLWPRNDVPFEQENPVRGVPLQNMPENCLAVLQICQECGAVLLSMNSCIKIENSTNCDFGRNRTHHPLVRNQVPLRLGYRAQTEAWKKSNSSKWCYSFRPVVRRS